jgi:hypothetical protein
MIWRSRIWVPAAIVFTLVNLLGGVYAAAMGEPIHAGVHAVLLLVGLPFMWRLLPKGSTRGLEPLGEWETGASPRQLDDRLTNLEQSVDAVAIEIERIGEGQRFMTNFFAENGTGRAAGKEAARPDSSKARDTPPDDRGA